MKHPGPAAWEDESFDVHFAFFARTDAATRLQILEGRRTRLQERLEGVRQSMARTRERLDGYTLELQRHGLDACEREVRWLEELITNERSGRTPSASAPAGNGAESGTTTSAADQAAGAPPEHPAPHQDRP